MGKFRKFWSLIGREKLFLFEACILLLLSNLSVKTLAFRHIESYLRVQWNDRSRDVDRPDDIKSDIKLVNLSLLRAANVLPWKSLCLSRSIAGLIMLRRRGIPAVLLSGVKSLEDSSLHAHAWVRTGNGVMDWNLDGDSDNSEFTVLVRIGHEPLLDSSRDAVY
jgi:Transglutaminase-like superfamily